MVVPRQMKSWMTRRNGTFSSFAGVTSRFLGEFVEPLRGID